MASQRGLDGIQFATIHSLLGCTKHREEGEIVFKPNPLKEQPIKDYDVVIIDECSMISSVMWGWLNTAEPKKVIVMGDPAQLPPVGEESSPSFEVPCSTLSTIMRNQGVIQAAGTRIRQNIMSRVAYVAKDAEDEHGIIRNLEADEWLDLLLARSDTAKALAFTNDSVDWINSWIREQRFGKDAPAYTEGERLVAVDGFEVHAQVMVHAESELKVKSAVVSEHLGLPCWKLRATSDVGLITLYTLDELQMPAYKAELTHARAKGKALGGKAWKEYYQLLEGFAKVRPGWATTVHKSQGSTYEDVFVLQTDIMRTAARDHAFRNMLLYVAYSRARKGLYLS
jgi:exodeoxyribonuclease-5